jgi:hypothetical protein
LSPWVLLPEFKRWQVLLQQLLHKHSHETERSLTDVFQCMLGVFSPSPRPHLPFASLTQKRAEIFRISAGKPPEPGLSASGLFVGTGSTMTEIMTRRSWFGRSHYRSGRKNSRRSSASSSGCSIAAKCPPLGIIVQRTIFKPRSASSRGGMAISLGKSAPATGGSTRFRRERLSNRWRDW